MNTVLVEALGRGLGVCEERARKGNLDKYAGDSAREFGKEWDDFLREERERIDEELWTRS